MDTAPPTLAIHKIPGGGGGGTDASASASASYTLSETYMVRNVNTATMCAIRRALMQDVPCLVLETVQLDTYTGPLEQEYIAHRIGQLPVCSVDGSGDGAVFTCRMTAPETPVGRLTMATTADFVLDRGHDGAAPMATMAWPDIDVVPLHPGQTVRLTARATRRTARTGGTRWQCVHVAVRPGAGEGSPATPPATDLTILTIDTTGAIPPRRALWHALTAIELRLAALAV
jgi:hypothetical protein